MSHKVGEIFEKKVRKKVMVRSQLGRFDKYEREKD